MEHVFINLENTKEAFRSQNPIHVVLILLRRMDYLVSLSHVFLFYRGFTELNSPLSYQVSLTPNHPAEIMLSPKNLANRLRNGKDFLERIRFIYRSYLPSPLESAQFPPMSYKCAEYIDMVVYVFTFNEKGRVFNQSSSAKNNLKCPLSRKQGINMNNKEHVFFKSLS